MDFVRLIEKDEQIKEMSLMATEIVREHYDPIIGVEQNDYMLEMFQSEDAIRKQLDHGYRYYFVREGERNVGFMAFFPRDNAMYLSKLYLYKSERGKGFARHMVDFVREEAGNEGLTGVELNVNKGNPSCLIYEKMGFKMIRAEKNDIGNGFYMDDYVYRLEI